MSITVTAEYLPAGDRDALVQWFAGQPAPQRVDLCLDLDDGTFFYQIHPDISDGMPARHWTGVVQTWTVPTLTPDAANTLLDRTTSLAQRILDDAEVVWDGSNHVGTLGADATAAHEEITEMINEFGTLTDEQMRGVVIRTSKAEEFFTDPQATAQTLAEAGFTADMTDERFDEVVERLIENVFAEHDMLLVRVDSWLERQQQELRDQAESA